MCCFTLLLLPVLGLVCMDFLVISRVSDHFAYLAIIPVTAAIAALAVSYLPGTLRYCPLIAAVVFLSVVTSHRARVIANGETLWRDTLQKNPESWTAHNNLGGILAKQNKLDAAIGEFQAAQRLNTNFVAALANLGHAYAEQRKYSEADQQFEAALKIKPADAAVQRSYGESLQEQGKPEEAANHLREAARLEPSPELRMELGALLHQNGDSAEAITQYRAALESEPELVEALNNLAWLLATSPEKSMRNGTEAVKHAEKACRLTRRKDARALGTLAASYAETGRFTEAVSTAGEAVAVAAAEGNGDFAESIRQLQAMFRSGHAFHEKAPQRNPQ
jgi:Flp pilus assembly protein TadD